MRQKRLARAHAEQIEGNVRFQAWFDDIKKVGQPKTGDTIKPAEGWRGTLAKIRGPDSYLTKGIEDEPIELAEEIQAKAK